MQTYMEVYDASVQSFQETMDLATQTAALAQTEMEIQVDTSEFNHD